MKLTTLIILKYKGCPIYIRRLGNHFEFLVIFKKEIYNEYIAAIPNWWNVFKDDPFTEKNVHDTAMILIGMAKHLINKLKK